MRGSRPLPRTDVTPQANPVAGGGRALPARPSDPDPGGAQCAPQLAVLLEDRAPNPVHPTERPARKGTGHFGSGTKSQWGEPGMRGPLGSPEAPPHPTPAPPGAAGLAPGAGRGCGHGLVGVRLPVWGEQGRAV